MFYKAITVILAGQKIDTRLFCRILDQICLDMLPERYFMNEPYDHFVISIMSRDHVGIIHEVSKALSELHGNIADVRQSVLCGYFTMILLASFPSNVTQRAIERKLAEADAHSENAIEVMVRKAEEAALLSFRPTPENAYVLTATGLDKIGIVATVSNFCVKHNINILDLSTAVSDGAYVMILVIDLNPTISISTVRKDLIQFSVETGLKVVLQHYDIFRAVNEINLPIH
jgi:predicted amino acid-binding ACT domain protein